MAMLAHRKFSQTVRLIRNQRIHQQLRIMRYLHMIRKNYSELPLRVTLLCVSLRALRLCEKQSLAQAQRRKGHTQLQSAIMTGFLSVNIITREAFATFRRIDIDNQIHVRVYEVCCDSYGLTGNLEVVLANL
jgi:hypothetical protein